MSQERYPVPDTLAKSSHFDKQEYQKLYEWSVNDPDNFWDEQAKRIDWFQPYAKVKKSSFGQRQCRYILVYRGETQRNLQLYRQAFKSAQ